jgi:hypothetical protein
MQHPTRGGILTMALMTLAAVGLNRVTAAELTLARDGKPAATIVIAGEPTRVAQFAAYELQWHVRAISGAELPIVRDDAPAEGTRILVGASSATAGLGLGDRDFGAQEYLVRCFPDTLVLMGRDHEDRGVVTYEAIPAPEAVATWPGIWDEQGTLYAVYDFLERSCGVRWFNPTEAGTILPAAATLAVAVQEVRRAPFFRYRYAAYPPSEQYDAYTGLWPAGSEGFAAWEAAAYPALRERFPDPGQYALAKRGWIQRFRLRLREGGEHCPCNHSLYGYYDRFWEPGADPTAAARFEARQADWFAQGYEGRPPQMCYTSRGLIEQVAKDAREFFAGQPTRPGAVAAGSFFCVEPMDNAQFCRCEACRALLTPAPETSPFFTNGLHSDYFFNFVNEVAREVRKTDPDKWIVTLAYMTHGAPPTRVVLEPNVAVQFCFACNRLNFDRPSYEHEIDLLKQWVAREPGRPLYLWLYYTFPVEVANNGRFHCFPGFFARAIGEQFELFREAGIRGMFHCGYGQEVEAYLTYRLMDDPAVSVEALLAEYFRLLYGAAAAPMQALYEAIEQTYSNPASYPPAIASGRREGHHHQTEEVAWGYLGNAPRMAAFEALLRQAQAAAQSDIERQRVRLFELGVWDYMVAGRQRYVEGIKAKHGPIGPPLRVPWILGPAPAGDPRQVLREDSVVLDGWRSEQGDRVDRDLEARLATDGRWLYVQLEEKGSSRPPVTLPNADANASRDDWIPAQSDYWLLRFAAQPGLPCRELAVGASRRVYCEERVDRDSPAAACDLGAVVQSEVVGRERWTVSLALPLDRLLPGGVQPGGRLFANIARRTVGGVDHPAWVPTFGDFWQDATRVRELVLETPASLPAERPSAAELAALDARDLVARWRLDERQGKTVRDSGPNRLDGKVSGNAVREHDPRAAFLRLEDRLGQYVDLGNPAAVNLSGALTLEAWVRYEPSGVWYPAVLGKGYEATGAYSLHLRPGSTLWFEIDEADGTRHFYNPTDRTLTPGAWCHVVATYDGQFMRIYINGREAGEGKAVAVAVRTTSEPLRIGWLGSYGHFNGGLRDVSLYRRGMAADEVFARYLVGR